MTMILNAPQPPPPPVPPPVADRAWLERADRGVRFLRAIILTLALVAIVAGVGLAQPTGGASLLVALGAIPTVIGAELACIALRSLIACAWALRRPDGQP